MFFDNGSWPEQPSDDETVWRYMDLARFISLLDSKSLFFTQASKMADKWEGAYGEGPFAVGTFQRYVQDTGVRHAMFLNCWHLSEYESAAMWDIYQREGRGVAIRSTWGELKASLRTREPIAGGKVTYVDYVGLTVSGTNVFDPFRYKRKSFEHEREVRLVYWGDDLVPGRSGTPGPPIPRRSSDYPPGVPMKVDLPSLIGKVFLAPDADAWLKPLIKRVLSKYRLEVDVVQSDLNVGPK
jgi:hypothetical protein